MEIHLVLVQLKQNKQTNKQKSYPQSVLVPSLSRNEWMNEYKEQLLMLLYINTINRFIGARKKRRKHKTRTSIIFDNFLSIDFFSFFFVESIQIPYPKRKKNFKKKITCKLWSIYKFSLHFLNIKKILPKIQNQKKNLIMMTTFEINRYSIFNRRWLSFIGIDYQHVLHVIDF